jgi:hypothetical protein
VSNKLASAEVSLHVFSNLAVLQVSIGGAYSPNELLLSLVNTKPTPSAEISGPPTADEVETQMAYVDQQSFDGYRRWWIKAIAAKRNSTNRSWPILLVRSFSKLGLVQVYRSDLDYTFKTERKLLHKFFCTTTGCQPEAGLLPTRDVRRLPNRGQVHFAPFTVVHSEEGHRAGESAGSDRESGGDGKNG